MSLVDHTQSVVVPYNIDNTFQATKNAIYKLNDYKIDSFNEIIPTFNLKRLQNYQYITCYILYNLIIMNIFRYTQHINHNILNNNHLLVEINIF